MKGPEILFTIGSIPVTETVVNAWLVMLVIIGAAYLGTRQLRVVPGKAQQVAELFVSTVYNMTEETMGKDKLAFAPYLGSLFIFSMLSSLFGLIGRRPPTADLNTTLAFALLTFFLVHFNGIRKKGLVGYFKGFLDPIPVMLPLNLISEIANPISLSFRHFGNIAGGMVISSLLYSFLAWLSQVALGAIPVLNQIPLLQFGLPALLSIYFDLFSAVMQAFIITMLSAVFISSAMD